jgi:hypothetical protein
VVSSHDNTALIYALVSQKHAYGLVDTNEEADGSARHLAAQTVRFAPLRVMLPANVNACRRLLNNRFAI